MGFSQGLYWKLFFRFQRDKPVPRGQGKAQQGSDGEEQGTAKLTLWRVFSVLFHAEALHSGSTGRVLSYFTSSDAVGVSGGEDFDILYFAEQWKLFFRIWVLRTGHNL